ncbi:glycosyltransferase [Salinicola sp. NYA28a]
MKMDFYSRFEERFRGDREDIKQRLKAYLPVLEPLHAVYPNGEALDLGCGRGEWLELLGEHGWLVRGVDTNSLMIDACHARDLNASEQDILEALTECEDGSLAVVSGFHIAEHLSFDDLLTLVEQAYRVLQPGGVLILETPNPENISVGLWSFYMDPTHRHPLPPPLLHFIGEDAGFSKVSVIRLNGPQVPDPDETLSRHMAWALSAYPDYAIVAHKAAGGEGQAIFDYLESLEQEHQSGIAYLERKLEENERHKQALSSDLASRESEVKTLTTRLARSEKKANELERTLLSLESSLSWRITAPVRELMAWLRGLPNRKTNGKQGSVPLGRHWVGHVGQRLARITWLKRGVLVIVDRFPPVKRRLQRLMAGAGSADIRLVRSHAKEEDYKDLQETLTASVRRRNLKLRDTFLPRTLIQDAWCGLSLEGHFEGSYSLATVNRHIVQRLSQDMPELTLSLVPREGEPRPTIEQIPGGEAQVQQWNALVGNKVFAALPIEQRVCLYHHYPLIDDVDQGRGLPIALFFWEESRVPTGMIETLNDHYAGVIVTAWFVKKTLMDSGCRLPIHVITLPLVANRNAQASQVSDLDRVADRRRINLLHVSSCFPRKGVDVLLDAFDKIAGRLAEVHLTIKSFPNPHNNIEAWIEECVSPRFQDRIRLILDDYDSEQMAQLYHEADAVVLPTRGEGLNMPAIEAGEFSRPLVVTGYGAHTDFATSENAWWVSYRFDRAQTHFSDAQSVWVEPGVDHLATRLLDLCRGLLANEREVQDHASHLHHHVRQRFLAPQATDSLLTALTRLKRFNEAPVPAPEGNGGVTMITTWGEPCGIAEYSRHLIESFPTDTAFEIVAPQDSMIQGAELPNLMAPPREGWIKGQVPDLRWIDARGDIVWLQHHFAFFDLDETLEKGVAALHSAGKSAYLTLHTTRPLLTLADSRQRAAAQSLNAFDRVFVHTLDDLNSLKRVGVTDNVVLIPQGITLSQQSAAPAMASASRDSNDMLVGGFGFLLPHKGIHVLIQAFSQFLESPAAPASARLRLMTTVRNDDLSRSELERCKSLAQSLGISEHIEWHTDFLPMEQVERMLSECDLLVLPYQYTEESSSAAVRTAIAACPHVATTPAPIFEEVRDITFPIEDFDADAIGRLLQEAAEGFDDDRRQHIESAREQWLASRHWGNIATQYWGMFQAARVERRFCESS